MDQQLLAKTFVELADNLVADFDIGYARSHNRRLADVARALIDSSEPLTGLGS